MKARRALWFALPAVLVAAAVAVFLGNPWSMAWIKGHAVHTFERRESIDREAAQYIFDLERNKESLRYDPVAHLAFLPGLDLESRWPEHPSGLFTLRTNNLGFREDRDTESAKKGPRVLVAGDSHTAGVVQNDETFANLLETHLRALPTSAGLEVLNAGVPFTGPHCYLGTLEKNLFLQPDVFVAVVFTGNDFWDDLKIRYVLDGWSPPRGDADYTQKIGEAAERWPGPVAQGLNQCYRFQHFPWEARRAVEVAAASLSSIRDLCSSRGIELLVVLLPTKADVEPDDDRETLEAALASLELSWEEAALNRTLSLELGAALSREKIRFLDPYDAMAAAPDPLYWKQDHHLSLAGHALLAELLEPRVRELLD